MTRPAACLFLLATSCAAAQVAAPPAYVSPFAVAGDPSATSTACPAGSTAVKSGVTDSAATQLAATVTFALQQQLTSTGAVSLLAPGTTIPAGAITFSGCLTRLEAGSKGKRVFVGMGSGGSFLGAHIVISRHTPAGDTVLRDFDAEVKGSNVAPPVFGGAIYNMAHLSKTSLEADTPRLAEKIVAQFRQSQLQAQPQPSPATQPAATASTPW